MPRKLTKDEAEKLYKGLFPGANYLIRLRERMAKAGFAQEDELFKLVVAAQSAMQHLRTVVHYMACESGVGRPPAENDTPGTH